MMMKSGEGGGRRPRKRRRALRRRRREKEGKTGQESRGKEDESKKEGKGNVSLRT